MQARVAAASAPSAACIFQGSRGCGSPVPLVQVSQGDLPVPADVAQYVLSIPHNVRDRPAVAREIKQYEYFASIRAAKQNQLVADQEAAKASPGDEVKKLKVMQDTGEAKASLTDENAALKRVKKTINMSIPLIP